MGIISAVPAPSRAIRVSPTAWALALDAATRDVPPLTTGRAENSPAPRVARLPHDLAPAARAEAWAELQELGVAKGSDVVPVWREALQTALTPVTILRLSAAYLGMGCNSDFSISGARGVAVLRRSTLEPDGEGGFRTIAHEPALEIALFDVAQIWGVIAPVLPPLTELRQDAAQDSAAAEHNVARIPLTPAEAAAVPEEAVLAAAMTTRAGESRQAWAGRWSVSRGTLYSVRTADGAAILTPQNPGHVAREITFALAGAYEFAVGGPRSA